MPVSLAGRGDAVSEAQAEFDPDWTIAPARVLRFCMDEHHFSPAILAHACGADADHLGEALALIQEVLDRKPLTEVHAALLARGTFVPEQFWLSLERGYRNDLAAGRKDTT